MIVRTLSALMAVIFAGFAAAAFQLAGECLRGRPHPSLFTRRDTVAVMRTLAVGALAISIAMARQA